MDLKIIKEAEQLSERLPELEWKLSQMEVEINPRVLPVGLFKSKIELSAQDYINEIKVNLQRLVKCQTIASATVLAKHVSQQINVLVHICLNNVVVDKRTPGLLTSLLTRQQWLENLNLEIVGLNKQRQALLATLDQYKIRRVSAEILLNLQHELGAVEQKLTLLQEQVDYR